MNESKRTGDGEVLANNALHLRMAQVVGENVLRNLGVGSLGAVVVRVMDDVDEAE